MGKVRKTLFASGRSNRRTPAGAIQGLVVSNLEQALGRVKQVNQDAAHEVGDIILKNTLPKVPMDSGDLRETGRVEVGESSKGNATVRVLFGNEKVDYAMYVHEDKPSNVEKKYTTAGTGPHYLQHGAAESMPEIEAMLRMRLKAATSNSSGGSGGTGNSS